MGFWDVTKRVLTGKPGFEAPKNDGDNWDDDAPTTDFAEERQQKRAASPADNGTLYDQKGYKHIPIMQVTNVKTAQKGDYLEVWVTFTNNSDRELYLDKIALLGLVTELDCPMRPGENRDFRAYRGKQMTHDHYKKAQLYYRDQLANDYFQADHMIVYRYENDKSYDVSELNLITPIKDI